MTLELDLEKTQYELNRAVILKIHYGTKYQEFKDDVKAFEIKTRELKKKLKEKYRNDLS